MGSAATYQLARTGQSRPRHRPLLAAARPWLDARRHAHHPPGDRRRRAIHAAGDAIARNLARPRARDRKRRCSRPTAASSCPARHQDLASHGENFFANTVAAAKKYGIPHEMLDAGQIRRRFPQFKVADDESAISNPVPGSCDRRNACARNWQLAEQHGARAAPRRTSQRPSTRPDRGVTVTTDRDTYAADRLIVTAGPWMPGLRRCTLSRGTSRSTGRCCAGSTSTARSRRSCRRIFRCSSGNCREAAGHLRLPRHRRRARRHQGRHRAVRRHDHADAVERTVSDREIRAMYDDYVAPYISGLSTRCVKAATCLYTVTPDFGFVIDTLPGDDARDRRVALLGPRLQAFGGDRRGAGGTRDRWREPPRPARIRPCALRA